MTNLEAEIKRLSTESGDSVETITAAIKESKEANGYDDDAAVAVWKDENSSKLGGEVVKGAVFRIIGREGPRTITPKDTAKDPFDIGSFGAFVVKADTLEFCKSVCWREDTKIMDDLDAGGLYKADVKFRKQNDDGSYDIRIIGEIKKLEGDEAKATKIPDAASLVSVYDCISVSRVEELEGETTLFKGISGAVKTGRDSGKKYFSVSDIGGNPVMVFPSDDDILEHVAPGRRIVVFGNVWKGRLNGYAVYPVKREAREEDKGEEVKEEGKS